MTSQAVVGLAIRELGEFAFVEECKAIFVTTNTSLARYSTEFFFGKAQAGSIPPSITDSILTTLQWLKRPVEAPDLPRKRLIADYFAAVQPTDRLWRRYQEEVSELERDEKITAEDYYLLRHTIQAKTALMDLTRGEENAFTRGSIPEILEKARARIREEIGKDLLDEIRLKDEALKKAKEFELRELGYSSVISQRAHAVASGLTKFVKYACFVLIALALVVSFPISIPQALAPIRYILFASLSFLFVLSLLDNGKAQPSKIY